MQCPNCGTQNDEGYKFCMRCGKPLLAEPVTLSSPPADAQASAEIPSYPPYTASYTPPSFTPSPAVPVQPVPVVSPVPSQAPPAYSSISEKSYPTQPSMPWQPAVMTGSTTSPLNIWGPFVGYGDRRRHVGWLMDNRGEYSETLIKKVEEKFSDRQIPDTNVSRITLIARGLIVESRPYFMLKRGLASVALYISQFGRDLFVSLASYLKPPISNFRVLILIASAMFFLYTTFVFPTVLGGKLESIFSTSSLFGGGPQVDTNSLILMLCVIGPLGTLNSLALFIFLVYSLYKWLTIKDFWAGLRVTPNEFNEDDLMAMEKAVEQTVRISMDQMGLDPNDLRQASPGDASRLI